jgi:hypothetical protein
VSFVNTVSLAGATLSPSKHDGSIVINDPHIHAGAKRSQIFLSFSTTASMVGVVSLSGSNLQEGSVTVNISTQSYALQSTDSIDYQIINPQ